jgi:hypothetical protein
MSKYGDLRKKFSRNMANLCKIFPKKCGDPIFVANHWPGGHVNLGPWVLNWTNTSIYPLLPQVLRRHILVQGWYCVWSYQLDRVLDTVYRP